ncbi:GrpB family protein [Chelativorans salis]|uniref:GrpB family protein n=1 Tax=Chelativorans salis TaxID=2978478 RepID=A0ABT2LUK0_9HYPH|nr:GrpB family protein [Chelativorans sp. EGI FJ00035]MCT7377759.1 GrpB family protein [Chelativorans sp. EGI FJ00035]
MLGLKHNTNILVDYDPGWETEFAGERDRLASALGSVARGIEHYGSTAVRGMRAKPILDILVGVAPLSDWRKCHDPLLDLGYDYAEHAGVPGHYIFGRGRDRTERTHLVHVVEFEGESWRTNLAFRDVLRRDAGLRGAYIEEKERAAAAAPDGRARYNELKRAFIDTVKTGLR